MPKIYAIEIGDEFVTETFPHYMAREIANARKFSLPSDAILFMIERGFGSTSVDEKDNVITHGFVVVPILDSLIDRIERDKTDEWASMTPEERSKSFLSKQDAPRSVPVDSVPALAHS